MKSIACIVLLALCLAPGVPGQDLIIHDHSEKMYAADFAAPTLAELVPPGYQGVARMGTHDTSFVMVRDEASLYRLDIEEGGLRRIDGLDLQGKDAVDIHASITETGKYLIRLGRIAGEDQVEYAAAYAQVVQPAYVGPSTLYRIDLATGIKSVLFQDHANSFCHYHDGIYFIINYPGTVDEYSLTMVDVRNGTKNQYRLSGFDPIDPHERFVSLAESDGKLITTTCNHVHALQKSKQEYRMVADIDSYGRNQFVSMDEHSVTFQNAETIIRYDNQRKTQETFSRRISPSG